MVLVGPPLLARAPSIGFVELTLFVPFTVIRESTSPMIEFVAVNEPVSLPSY
ncbi:unannotated protein [freshwater metagenome]|uniref:Unannotated protein n=1 Tax=freshwater metagenome TaxID=449393 RepID=A0A6J6EKY0_9ZZZZ